MSEEAITVFQLLGVPEKYEHVAGAALAAALLTGFGLIVKSKLKNPESRILPDAHISLLNIAESIGTAFKGLVGQMIEHGEKFVPIIGATFLFILGCNLIGLVPGFEPPTHSLNTDLAMGVSVFVAYQYMAIREHGVSYWKHFTAGLSPISFLKAKSFWAFVLELILSAVAIMLFGIEIVGHIIRPVSLSLRLWGNINGDHTLVGVFNGLTPLFIPIIVMVLGVFVSVVQALVFSLLSTVYFKLAVSHDH